MAEVCVNPREQKMGYGRIIVQKVFVQINNTSEVCLFQTGVPIFYEKIGCRIADNNFINSKNKIFPESNPWHDDFVMIYAPDYDLPEGTVDINGSGY